MPGRLLKSARVLGVCSLLLAGCWESAFATEGANPARIPVFVTILPQVFFVEQIGGDRVEVTAMVEPGRSPETFEPSPQQLAKLSRAVLYFRVGIGFEEAWLKRVQQMHKGLRIVDTRKGVPLLASHHSHPGEEAGVDPHIWVDPRRVRIQAANIERALEEVDPAGSPVYQANLSRFVSALDELDAELKELFRNDPGKKFLVWHPAWGYLADAYGLEQFAIEQEGKEPNAKRLTEILDQTRREGFQILFVPEQTRTRAMESLAKAAGLRIVRLDPLAKDYLVNVRAMAGHIAEGLR